MYARVRQDDTGPGGVFDGEAGLAVLARDAADGAREVVAAEHLHVLYLEGVDEEVVEAEERHRVLDLEAQHVRLDKVRPLLDRPGVRRVLRRFELHAPHLWVVPDLEHQVLDDGGHHRVPLGAQRGEAVRGDPDPTVLLRTRAHLLRRQGREVRHHGLIPIHVRLRRRGPGGELLSGDRRNFRVSIFRFADPSRLGGATAAAATPLPSPIIISHASHWTDAFRTEYKQTPN
mmetsp:Transcript_21733/g.49136  ORF Transcript_21733/g.49136 Transcript_21733/m.49136 type:complete len:231 (-) Transcript_21733:19-711(-)